MFLLLALIIYTACILNWDVQTVVFASIGLLIFSGPVVSVPLMLIHALVKRQTNQKVSEEQEEKTGIPWLRQELKEPGFFNTIGKGNFDKIIKFIEDGLNNKKTEVVFLEAEIGMGKTRLAKASL